MNAGKVHADQTFPPKRAPSSAVPTARRWGSNPKGEIPYGQKHYEMKALERLYRSDKYLALQRNDTDTQSEKQQQMNWIMSSHQLLTVRTPHSTEHGAQPRWRDGARQACDSGCFRSAEGEPGENVAGRNENYRHAGGSEQRLDCAVTWSMKPGDGSGREFPRHSGDWAEISTWVGEDLGDFKHTTLVFELLRF